MNAVPTDTPDLIRKLHDAVPTKELHERKADISGTKTSNFGQAEGCPYAPCRGKLDSGLRQETFAQRKQKLYHKTLHNHG